MFFSWPAQTIIRNICQRRQANMELYDGLNGDAADISYSYSDEFNLELDICQETGKAGIVV
jgi:hypothetical protein